jgi:ferric-dicitrate binding protein FerR (iron transport regulator)
MTEQNKNMKALLEKYLNHGCSDEETLEVLRYLDTEEGKRYMDEYIAAAIEEKDETPAGLSSSEKKSFEKLMGRINEEEENKGAQIISLAGRQRPWYFKFAVAGVILLLLGSSLIYFNRTRLHAVHETTALHDRKNILLPDGSEVTLYENSSLSYSDNFTQNNRNVYLTGEAFFKVQHTVTNSTFTVHTSDSLAVHVVGTRFEVSALEGKSRVILEEGKVIVSMPDTTVNASKVLQPGDMLLINDKTSQTESRKVNASLYTGRSQKVFALNHTEFSQIISMMHEIYGYDVILPDDKIKSQAFSGTLPNASLTDILDGISKLIGLKYTIHEKNILFY